MTPQTTATDSARDDPGPKTSAAERAEAWHREHDARAAKVAQREANRLAEQREADRQRGEALRGAVTRALEAHSEKVSELRLAEAKVEQLRAERSHLPADFHARIDRVVEAAEKRVELALAATAGNTLPGMVPRLPPGLAVDWLLATDPHLAERWHAVSDEEMSGSAVYSDRTAKDIAKDLTTATKAVEQARKVEREAHEALGAAREQLHSWEVGA